MRGKNPRRPAKRSRARTTETSRPSTNSLVHVRTRSDWPREEFMRWLDEQRNRAGYVNDSALADAAGISHSTISGWRNGRQKPTQQSLTSAAEALGIDPRHLWIRAGLLTAEELGFETDAAEPGPLADADSAARQAISSSRLTADRKAALMALLDDLAHSDAARRFEVIEKLVRA